VAKKAEGLSNRAVAEKVGVDEGTVRNVLSAEIQHSAEIPQPDELDAGAGETSAADLLAALDTPEPPRRFSPIGSLA
jgi:hypothetical protein